MRTISFVILAVVIVAAEARHTHHIKRLETAARRSGSTYPTNVQVVSEGRVGQKYRATVNIGGPQTAAILKDCTELCQYEQECVCASYNTVGKACWLHKQCSTAPIEKAEWVAVAPVAFNERQGRRYISCRIVASTSVDSTEDCAQECAWKDACIAAVYRPQERTCTLCRDYGSSKSPEGSQVNEDVIALERSQLALSTKWGSNSGRNLDNRVSGVVLPECLQMCVAHGASCCGASFNLAENECWTHSTCDSPAVLVPMTDIPWLAYTV